MEEFDHILDWKLLEGSHEFPGPDGGTCVNEAAILAAGLPYREVAEVSDLPECFCPVIGAFAMAVNDHMREGPRQRLIPFITRLAGSRSRLSITQRRHNFIVTQWARRILPRLLDAVGFTDEAERCRQEKTLPALRTAAKHASIRLTPYVEGQRYSAYDPDTLKIVKRACDRVLSCHNMEVTPLLVTDGKFFRGPMLLVFGRCVEAQSLYEYANIWDDTIDILDEALAIGEEQEIDPETAARRLERARRYTSIEATDADRHREMVEIDL